MRLRTASAGLALAALLGVSAPATTSLMPIDEIRPGMVGVGKTVFQGTELQEFKAQIIGVLRNIQGPKRDLILARLEGGPLADTGVAQGMSGSPVYIDGRLIGAVSYSIGAFSKEPIAGITPIAEMKDATETRRRTTQQARIELPITRETLTAALAAAYNRLAPFARRPADVQAIGLPAAAGGQIGAMLRPISTPLVLSGFEPDVADLVSGPFREAGFSPMMTGGADQAKPAAGPLREGDPIGVALVRGDLEMGATGTVTHIDGDRVYAFGHPFYNLGPAEFPFTRAYVHVMLPSLMTSFKIASMGETIGTMQQDRATAIAGTLGKGPSMVPMTVTLQSDRTGADPASKRVLKYELVNDQMFTPLVAYVSMFNTLTAYERQFGAATVAIRSQARIKGQRDLTIEDVFTGESPLIGASMSIIGPMTMLLGNDIERIALESLDISVTTSETPRTVSIERVWLDEIRPRPGRTVPLKVLTRSYRGEEKISTIPIDIPANATGDLSVLVTDGRQLNAMEQRDLRRSLQPQTVAQMVRLLNDTRRNNRLYIRLLTGRAGAVVDGEAMTALPPSVLAVLEGDRNGGSFTPIRSATVGEWEIPMDSAVTGSRILTINVEGR